MKIGAGMYVRTKQGYMCKILKLNEPECDDGYLNFNDIHSPRIQEKYIVNVSNNIIDLIEVGDYVNGMKVYKDDELDYLYVQCIGGDGEPYHQSITKQSFISSIKSIVTKEQFEQVSYKIGD